MPPSLHSSAGASSAHRWAECTPSLKLCEKLDQRFGKKSSPFAEEGTKAHELAEIKVRRAIWEFDNMTPEIHGSMSEAEVKDYPGINEARYQALREALGEIPDDMETATNIYCDVIINKLTQARAADPGTQIYLEQRLDYSRWVPTGFGTGDCIIVSDQLIEICDYKHGKGIPVSAENNPQIRLYALGAYDLFESLFDFKAVRGTIIQPRLNSISEETLALEDLLHWADTYIVPRAKLALAGQGEFVPGEHCRFCSAKAVCAARVSQGLKAVQYGMDTPGLVPDEQLPEILAVIDDLVDWAKDFKDYCERQAINGQSIRGYKLVRGKKPNRSWSNPEEVEAQLLRVGYGVEQFRETRLKPVGEIEKQLGKTAFNALLGSMVVQGEGRLTLVPESDKRIAVSAAATAFGDLSDEVPTPQ